MRSSLSDACGVKQSGIEDMKAIINYQYNQEFVDEKIAQHEAKLSDIKLRKET